MDPYAQQMLEKARQRSKNLGIKTDFNALGEIHQNYPKTPSTYTNISANKELCENKTKSNHGIIYPSTSKSSKQTFTMGKENLGIEINVTSDHRIEEVQIEVQEYDASCKKEIYCTNEEKQIRTKKDENQIKIRDCSRNRLQRLGALYSNPDEISSPIHRTENKFCEETIEESNKETQNKRPTHKLNKLTELANEIKNWEDEDEIKKTKNNFDDHKIETTKERQITENEVTKKLKWDHNVMQSLEAQGFQRRESSTTKLSYNYSEVPSNNANKKTVSQNVSNIEKTISKNNSESSIKDNRNIAGPSTVRIKPSISSSIKPVYKDPIDMPLRERMKLFEQNKGNAPVPKVPFGMNVPAKKICNEAVKEHSWLKTAHQKLGFEKNEKNIGNLELLSKNKSVQIETRTDPKIQNTLKFKSSQMESKFENNKQENSITKDIAVQGNLSAIVSQFENKTELKEEKKEKNSPKRLYPNLNEFKSNSEIESGTCGDECSTDKLSEDDEPLTKRKSNDSSFDEKHMSLNISYDSINLEKPQVRFDISEKKDGDTFSKSTSDEHYYNSSDSSINSKTTENSGEISDYLNDAFDDNEEDNDDNASVTTNTDSIINARNLPTTSNQNVNQVKSQLSVEETNEDMVTLVHTISFYRKQQNNSSNPSTPIKRISRDQQVRRVISEKYESSETENDLDIDEREIEARLVKDKLSKLRDEVCKQQQIIAQTSQALNLCAATIEFSGSTEAVEGERHLLVATHRRQAALDEIQRLRVEGVVRSSSAPGEKGRLTVTEITIPLRQDYIRKLSNDAISGHHLLCLMKYNEVVLATQTVPTLPGLVAVKFPDVLHLNEVYADFCITLEIYGMTAQREILPHEIKYHINLNKNKNSRTPKKKATDSRLIMPMVQSPAGPNVVRTPALVQYGFAIFSMREVQRRSWTLTKVSGVSPLEGTVNMKVNCELSVSFTHKGFLTMFEDISGFGAWHRRWCCLSHHIINYWKYPDDEKISPPIGSIDLSTVLTKIVTTAPRDICARLNTFMLESKIDCSDEAAVSRKSSLMTMTKDNMTIIRYLLSADTKPERDQWCSYLNRSLALLRAWNHPVDRNIKES